MKIELVQATKADIPLLNDLAQSIWKDYYPAIITHEQIDYMLDKFYSTTALTQQLLDGHRFHLIYSDDICIGYLSENVVDKGEYFLNKFYIDAKYQGQSIGKEVFKRIFSAKEDLKNMRLTVNRKNYKAINFYFRLGFVIEKVEDFDIGNGFQMNDFVMLFKKGSNPSFSV